MSEFRRDVARPGLRASGRLSAALAGGILLTVGCASPGVPRAPSLRLPEMAEKLTAARVGGDVTLTWMTSGNTTDGAKIRGSVTAVVCRERGKEACAEVLRKVVAPGAASATETLPPEERSGALRLLAYRVELLNERGRSAGKSDEVFVLGGAAPEPVGPLSLTAEREAVLVRWKPAPFAGGRGAMMELKRTLTATAAGALHSAQPTSAEARRAPRTSRPGMAGTAGASAGKSPSREVTLIAEARAGEDPGGTVDSGVRDQNSYVYVAQRVAKVTLEGHELELRGISSPPTNFVYRDTFPPRAPVGLVSVPGGGFEAAPSIDLSWETNPEDDVVGYNVYRREGGGAFVRLTAEPVAGAAYRDLKVEAGREYTYRVTALDQRHNESAPSNEVRESLRK